MVHSLSAPGEDDATQSPLPPHAPITECTMTPCPSRICALIPAAGLSTRMGGKPKALTRLYGRSFLEHVARLFLSAGVARLFVVTGHGVRDVEQEASAVNHSLAGLAITPVYNSRYTEGMLGSIQAGMAAIERHYPEMDGCFLLPVDMPLVSPATVRYLHTCWQALENPRARIIMPCHNGHTGHPPLFGRDFFSGIIHSQSPEGLRSHLVSLLTDKGAAENLRARKPFADTPESPILCREVEDACISRDIDTPEMLARAESEHALKQTVSQEYYSDSIRT